MTSLETPHDNRDRPPQLLAPKRVQVLDPHVAERIAAGEVIERPSSVVKELIENSLDAGASEIQVTLEDGGKGLIEVLDNGHGMTPEDLSLCIRRHATSKLSSLEDLERLSTLGFRGEALPSIGAVSDLSLLSRTAASETAYELALKSLHEAPKPVAVTFGHFLAKKHGTRIQARGLFSQVPARLKFLKSQSAEVAQVREWMERLALAHPRVGFRLISDKRTVLNLKPQSEIERVQAILSDGDEYPIVTAEKFSSGVQVRAHWLQGLSSPQTRRLVQVVNGRSVRDRMLQQAVLSAFRQALLPGQFPAVALFVEVDPGRIDVNVHPTKTEIRFLESREIFHAVDTLISQMIENRGAPAFVPTRSGEMPSSAPASAPVAWDFSKPASVSQELPAGATPAGPVQWAASEPAFSFRSQPTAWQDRPRVPAHSPLYQPELGAALNTPTTRSYDPPAENSAPAQESNAARPLRHGLLLNPGQFMGTAFNTYLFYDLGNELVLVDQHAAHERIRYERLRKRILSQESPQVAQSLLIPEAIRFDAEQRLILEERLPWLETIGFEAELFGEDTLLFRAVPGEWGTGELRIRLKNLVDRLLALDLTDKKHQTPREILMDEDLFEALASEACHSAVRAGDRLEDLEVTKLVDQLWDCEHPWNCPHGRPTIVRIPKGKVEEWFQRRV